VVSTAVLGTKEVLRNAAGALVVAEDVTEFSAAVVRVLTQPPLRAALASAGREFVARHWSSLEMAKRLAELYDEIATAASAIGDTSRSGINPPTLPAVRDID
jgi:glycosyltransferase involved in cell wall biosynthesis